MPYRLTKCVDHDMNHLSYLAFFEDVEIRKARGERQYKCAECGLWQWPRHPARSVRQSESKSTEHQPVEDRT